MAIETAKKKISLKFYVDRCIPQCGGFEVNIEKVGDYPAPDIVKGNMIS